MQLIPKATAQGGKLGIRARSHLQLRLVVDVREGVREPLVLSADQPACTCMPSREPRHRSSASP